MGVSVPNFIFYFCSLAFLVAGMDYTWLYIIRWRGGIKFDDSFTDPYPSENSVPAQEPYFNLHVLFMMFGFWLPNALAAGAFRFLTFVPREWAKQTHVIFNTLGLVSSLAGFGLVYKHEWAAYRIHFLTPHTMIGGMTLILYAVQWITGILFYATDLVPVSLKKAWMPIHRTAGQLMFVFISISCFTGLLTNYAYDLKYTEEMDKDEKYTKMNVATTLLAVGVFGISAFLLNDYFVRPKDVVKDKLEKKIEDESHEASL